MFGFIRKVDAAKGNSPMRAKHERNRTDVLLQALGCFREPRFWITSGLPTNHPESPHLHGTYYVGYNCTHPWL